LSLQTILQAIENTGEAQVREIASRADLQAREMIAKASLEAETIREQACAAALEPATRERARLIQKARLEALQTVGEKREALVDTALEETRKRLACSRAEARYPEVLKRLIREAWLELDSSQGVAESGRKICLDVDPRDRGIVEGFTAESGLSLAVNFSLTCWGGVIARSEDGRVTVIDTLEARLERAEPFLRSYLAALFEEENWETDERQAREKSAVV
jgi:vacuolar-type H+-ATPase subunit E/Vma4